MSKTILDATTAAAQSSDIAATTIFKGDGALPVHVTAPGLAPGEYATVQKKNVDDSYSDYYINETKQQISSTHTGIVIEAPGIYRIDKDATAAAVPVEVSTSVSP